MATGTASAGYVLEGLVFPVQSLTIAYSSESQQDAEWGWDWQWRDHDHFEVALSFLAPPTNLRPEVLQVNANAIFRVVGELQTVPVAAFAHSHAPALIFPYIRQIIDELTSRSPFGRVLLPPTNIIALMSMFDAQSAKGSNMPRPV